MILVLVGVLMAGVYRQGKHRSQNKPKEVAQTDHAPIPASPEVVYAAQPYAENINRAQAYFNKSFSQTSPVTRLLLDYLQRKYGLSPKLSAAITPIQPPIAGQQVDNAQFQVFNRISYPGDLVNVLPPAQDDPMTQMMMSALYCDRIPLSKDFRQLVQTNIDAGGYNLTHVEFSLQRLKENNCHPFSLPDQQAISKDIAVRMVSLIEDPKTIPDLRYEAVAFLLDMDQGYLVKTEWITQIVSEQRPDGSWKVRSSQKDSDTTGVDHATMLALWALLQLSRPSVPTEPMLHHPK